MKALAALPAVNALPHFYFMKSSLDEKRGAAAADVREGASAGIENEFTLFLPGEREKLRVAPRTLAVTGGSVTAEAGETQKKMVVGDTLDGWSLVAILPWYGGISTAVFEKRVTHRGVIAYVNPNGEIARIPTYVGDLSRIRPRPVQPPAGIKFERAAELAPGRDTLGEYILHHNEDPRYETIAPLGPEFTGWTFVGNEETGPEKSLWLEADGRSRQSAGKPQSNWAPDVDGRVFEPSRFLPSEYLYDYVAGYSKRTLLGGFLPAADIGVWNPHYNIGYEVMMVIPPGEDARPVARVRALLPPSARHDLIPQGDSNATQALPPGPEVNHFWNGDANDFYATALGVWNKWHHFFEDRMKVEIPDEWLLNAARGGLALSRASYRGLEPTYQIGEGAYTKIPERSHALFPVAHYEFVWAHQLWNLTEEVDPYFQHYLDKYILPDGNFVYNTQDQVEGPLNVGIFLENSARAYDYSHDIEALRKRVPVLRRMTDYVRRRYEYSRETFQADDPRYGLIWGSPEADVGDPADDYPESHPYFYQNSACVWRGLREHARCLERAAAEHDDAALRAEATEFKTFADSLRTDVERSLAKTMAARNPEMKSAGISPFDPFDTRRKPTELSSYENHRYMEDWFLSDWGDQELDAGHLAHREIAGLQVLGMNLDGAYPRTSNFMSHGTLAARIRQDDYRPFLMTLYALCTFAMDSGNCYAPEDAMLPGGYPGDGSQYGWSAVVNSELQAALGLRWLLCYEEHGRELVHLQKAAPKHWFAPGEAIRVENCPTRFGHITWRTEALADGKRWRVRVQVERGFKADILLHIHTPDGGVLKSATAGNLEKQGILLPAALFANQNWVELEIA
jgi:hypothetical protein